MSLAFYSARYVAAPEPLAAGWAIMTFGGILAAPWVIARIQDAMSSSLRSRRSPDRRRKGGRRRDVPAD